jgi:biotin synthase-related radical SAM superfamily protein
MTYKVGKCTANCGFCPQARGSKSSIELLSRVSWPTFPTAQVITALGKAIEKSAIKRVCIQALNYPNVFSHLQALVKEIKSQADVPVSVSCQPLNKQNIELLRRAGVDRLGVALDAATEAVFDRVKGRDAGSSYSWEGQFRLLTEALAVFGKGNLSTHVIVGLGETERETTEIIQRCVDMGVLPALFAFTPVRGTALESKAPPELNSYRRIQVARYLIVKGLGRFEGMKFDGEGKLLSFGLPDEKIKSAIQSGEPFQTSGCQNCNRPFYNEKPSGPIYNYPIKPKKKEIEKIEQQLTDGLRD